MQHWKKLGKILEPNEHFFGNLWPKAKWMGQGAAVPFYERINDDVVRIHFSFRDEKNRSHPSWVDLEPENSFKIVNVATQPTLDLGISGYFDDSGVMGTELIQLGEKTFFYYIGWNRSVSVPFRNAMGLAIRLKPNDPFVKYSSGPILDRSPFDPCFVASCGILQEQDKLKMYYLSCVRWFEEAPGKLQHAYHIKMAESKDGIHWDRKGHVAIDFMHPGEYALSTPRVIKDGSLYKMWYSYRSGPYSQFYRIGYAESADSYNWERKDDQVKLDVTEGAWDSDMICYPSVLDFKGGRYMFYNGNGYGRSGIGVAVLDQ